MQTNISSFFQRRPSPNIESSSSSSKPLKIDLDNLPWDPAERKPISSYHPSQKDEIRRAYLLRGPCQPKGKKEDFPRTLIGNGDKLRRFNPKWYTGSHGNWLEYSFKTDRVYCLYCYLFKESGQNDAFATEGVQCWHRKEERFEAHVGRHNSFHDKAYKKGQDLLIEAQHVNAVLEKRTEKQKQEYRLRLSASVMLTKAFLNGGIPFRGHDESEGSSYKGNFLEFLELFGQISEEIGKVILSNAPGNSQRSQANGSQLYMRSFKFVFYLHLMKHILGVTNALCVTLQRKNQDIMNAVGLVKSTKEELQRYRLQGFDSLLKDVATFCEKYDIEMINMEDIYVDPKNKRRKANITNRHHYMVNNFNTVLDMQIQEFGDRFNEVTTELLTCMSSLSPCHNFSAFNKLNLLKLAEMYPFDFTLDEKDKLMYELSHYITNVKEDSRFDNLDGVNDLAKRMVETRKHIDYQLVYRLIKLSLVLPVATASVERCFSSMKYVKNELLNEMGDGYLNDTCICYIERELLQKVTIENVMQRFQKMKTRREQL